MFSTFGGINALKGNYREKKGEGKIFGSDSRAPISISVLIKNPNARQHGQIHYHDIGDYLDRQQKLDIIQKYASIAGITAANGWQSITPDQYHDWLNQRDNSFEKLIPMGDKKNRNVPQIFANYSRGLESGRIANQYSTHHRLLQ